MKKRILSFLLVLLLVCSALPPTPAHAEIREKLYICGVIVTDENCADVLGDGRFSYDPAANVLTIRGSGSHDKSVIANYIPKLTIYVARDATLYSTDDAGLLLRADTTITGPGLLKAEGDYGISAQHGAGVTLRNANVDAWGKFYGIDGLPQTGYKGNVLTIENSYVHAAAEVHGAIQDFETISRSGCSLTEPEGGWIAEGTVRDKDGNVAKSVTLEPPAYDLWIAGKQVTSANCTDVLCNGAFSYDAAAKVLSVKGDCTTAEMAIRNKIEALTVRVEKDSTLESTGPSFTITSFQDLTITGPGELTLISANSALAVYDDHTLTLENAKLRVNAATVAITSASQREKLVIRGSKIEAQGGNRAFWTFATITMEGCRIVEPVGGKISGGTIVDADEVPAKKVTIGEVTYPLWIAGTQATGTNAADVLGDGAFSYDVYENTLTVRGDADSGTVSVINNQVSGLTLCVAADVTLTSAGLNAITTSRDMTITGSGRLSLSSPLNSGIHVSSGAILTVDGVRLDVKARLGLSGHLDKEKLVIRNSDVQIQATEAAVVNFMGGIVFDGCEITLPKNAAITDGSVLDKDGNPVKKLTIEPLRYELRIAGTQVTTANAADIRGDGCFSYDAKTNVLTVRGDCFNPGSYVLINGIDALTVYVAENAAMVGGTEVLSTSADLTITGPGTLTVRSSSGCAILAGSGASLTIKNAGVSAEGRWGIGGTPSGEKLIVRNSNVSAIGTEGAICDFDGGITLTGCAITAPNPYHIADGSVCDELGKATEVHIASAAISSLTRAGDTFHFTLEGTPPEGARLIVAAYNGNGRMLAARIVEDLSADSFTFAVPENATVKAFLVDANGAPLCPSRTAV